MNCKHLTLRSKKGKKYYYCRLMKEEISLSYCQECDSKEYKIYKPLKKKTYKQTKKEKNRFSMIYHDLTKCCECGSKIGVQKNEIYEGAYRKRSIEYGAIAPMCHNCHTRFHNNSTFNLYYKVMFEKEFLKTHSKEEFIKVFGQDYIFKLSKKTNKKRLKLLN